MNVFFCVLQLKRKKNVGAEFDEYQSSEDEVENEDDDATTARRRFTTAFI